MNVYEERSRVLAALAATLSTNKHVRCYLAHDPEGEDGFQTLLVIDHEHFGQCTWHIADSDVHHFSFLDYDTFSYDGHTTAEKYSRLEDITARYR